MKDDSLISDELLMSMYRAGDVRGFEVLLARYRKPIFNFILRSVRELAIAEDLLQEAFLRVVKSANAYEGSAKFSSWLYAIARNLCIDHARRSRYRDHASLDARPDCHVSVAAIDRMRAQRELQLNVQRAIAGLSDEQRDVLRMHEALAMSFPQIGKAVGVPARTARTRLLYALAKLRHALAAYANPAVTS
jgi:RNA polymerase sigma-70 factor (ECF subfamily)